MCDRRAPPCAPAHMGNEPLAPRRARGKAVEPHISGPPAPLFPRFAVRCLGEGECAEVTSSPEGVNEGRRLSDSCARHRVQDGPINARSSSRRSTGHSAQRRRPGRLTAGRFPRGGLRAKTAAAIDQRGGGILARKSPGSSRPRSQPARGEGRTRWKRENITQHTDCSHQPPARESAGKNLKPGGVPRQGGQSPRLQLETPGMRRPGPGRTGRSRMIEPRPRPSLALHLVDRQRTGW